MVREAAKPAEGLGRVILASSAGTLIEWYDFFVFGALATILSKQFYPQTSSALLSTLATFAAGFVFRPFGAAFFGRMGDIIGRKYTFLLTLLMMGLSTVGIGLIPTYAQVGVLAPILAVTLRIVQGLAIGGEYGGAATYVAEHSPPHRQGYYTSFIQATATAALFVALAVIMITRASISEASFNDWGWRIPFLLSAVLVVISYVIRRKMAESPVFAKIKEEGRVSKSPILESFRDRENRRLIFIALFGAVAGQGVIWYLAQFYASIFLQTFVNIQAAAVSKILATALIAATPLYVVFGAWSDRIGRKKLMVTGLFLATVCSMPIYATMQAVGTVQASAPATVEVKSKTDVAAHKTTTSRIETIADDGGSIQTTTTALDPATLTPLPKEKAKVEVIPGQRMYYTLAILIFVQVVFSAMVYGPMAAFLVALFPPRLRYTSLSIPYHLGNGIFGGFVPLISTWLVDLTGNKLSGLYYPMLVAGGTCLVAIIFMKETWTPEGFSEDAPKAA